VSGAHVGGITVITTTSPCKMSTKL